MLAPSRQQWKSTRVRAEVSKIRRRPSYSLERKGVPRARRKTGGCAMSQEPKKLYRVKNFHGEYYLASTDIIRESPAHYIIGEDWYQPVGWSNVVPMEHANLSPSDAIAAYRKQIEDAKVAADKAYEAGLAGIAKLEEELAEGGASI
jgi:hypothetical protein